MKCSLVSLIFLKRSLVFPSLLLSSISLHRSPRKVFLSLLAILWNSAFKWVSFLLPLACLLFSAICKNSDSHFAFLHFFFLGIVLITTSCKMSWTSVHSSSGTLFTESNLSNLCINFTVNHNGFDFRSYVNGLVVFPTFFNLSLNLSIRSSWSEPQLAPGLVLADCIELLHIRYSTYTCACI